VFAILATTLSAAVAATLTSHRTERPAEFDNVSRACWPCRATGAEETTPADGTDRRLCLACLRAVRCPCRSAATPFRQEGRSQS